MSKKVEAELKEMYKVTVGHNGVCMGCYDPSDEWKESYYGDTIEELVETMSVEYFNGLPNEFDLELVEVLIYEGRKFDYRLLAEYNKYNKDTKLKAEAAQFTLLWNSEKYKNIRESLKNAAKIKKEREKKLEEIKLKEEKEKKELEEYLKLKSKYENENK